MASAANKTSGADRSASDDGSGVIVTSGEVMAGVRTPCGLRLMESATPLGSEVRAGFKPAASLKTENAKRLPAVLLPVGDVMAGPEKFSVKVRLLAKV